MNNISVDTFTNATKFDSLSNSLSTGAKVLNINGNGIKVDGGKVAGKLDATIKPDKGISLKDYTPPSTLVLDTFSQLGKDIDDSIKSSFLLQSFHIKGTDVLCTTFCFILATMSCSARNDLYKMLTKTTNTTNALSATSKSISQAIIGSNLTIASAKSITQSAKNLFGGGSVNKENIGGTVAAAATMIAAPIGVIKIVQNVLNVLKVGAQFKMVLPNSLGAAVWDLAQNVLYQVQSMALQAADEALNKLIKPIEDMFDHITKEFMPNCIGTMGTRLFASIIDSIKAYKGMILGEIGDLFKSSHDFNKKLQSINKKSAFSLEQEAFALALKTIAANFVEIARNCGVQPCSSDGIVPNEVFNQHNVLGLDDTPEIVLNNLKSTPNYFGASSKIPKIDELAEKVAPSMKIDNGNVFVTPQEIIGVYDLADNAPKKIIEIINSGALNNILDDNYSVYKTPDNEIKVIYKFQRNCGD